MESKQTLTNPRNFLPHFSSGALPSSTTTTTQTTPRSLFPSTTEPTSAAATRTSSLASPSPSPSTTTTSTSSSGLAGNSNHKTPRRLSPFLPSPQQQQQEHLELKQQIQSAARLTAVSEVGVREDERGYDPCLEDNYKVRMFLTYTG